MPLPEIRTDNTVSPAFLLHVIEIFSLNYHFSTFLFQELQ